ncbi:MAG TPA: HAMP domain-containing sensor histidine kinase [Salinivirgaceae bacterium]|nr:HAMP domain-containing sensor histidine kinase [Salinivirgaceae bacterium]
MNHKRKLLIGFFAIFLVYAFVIAWLQYYKEKEYQTNNQKETLRILATTAEKMLENSADTEEVLQYLPQEVRLTLIDSDGGLVYDNIASNVVENHFGRPEIYSANYSNEGYAIRKSSTTDQEYLYYARKCKDGSFLRLALPYVISWTNFIHFDNILLYIIVFLFFITLLVLVIITDKFDNVMRTLINFVTDVEKGNIDYNKIHFPDTHSGEIGRKIISLYKQLEDSKLQTIHEKDKNRLMKQEMTNNIAHELKTPVSSIRGYLEILLNNKDIGFEKQQYFIERSHAQTLRLSNLIQDVALITKLEESANLFPKEKLDLYEIFEEAATEWEEVSKEQNVTIENRIPEKSFFAGNYNLMFSIFRNLIENSIRYAGDNIKIVVECVEQDKTSYRLRYYDTGVGVNKEHLDKIFDRFLRIDKGRSRKSGGTGLGLSIVKHAVQFHGGTIVARNRPEGGLLFDFNILK